MWLNIGNWKFFNNLTTDHILSELHFAAYSNRKYENLTLCFNLIPSLLFLVVILTLVEILQDLEELEKDANNVDVERKSGKNVLLW